jgi:hypothetical protein
MYYLTSSWNKSVWTYSYILKLIEFFDFDIPIVAKRVYRELSNHFTKKDEATGRSDLTGCYDNVFNATCKMLEILNYFQNKYQDVSHDDSLHVIDDVIQSADTWILGKIEAESIVDQDICYCLLYLLKNGRYDSLDDTIKAKLTKLLANVIEESLALKTQSRSSIDLCRVYQTLCMLRTNETLVGKKTVTYLRKIESILKERQDASGIWKNISDTAEITAMLIETYELRSAIDTSLNTINTLITKGIEVLHSQFNPRTNMWSDDLGTTAKAMYAIGAYDKQFNFAINDFFLDLKTNQETRIELNEETNIGRIASLYETIDELEKEKKFLNEQSMADRQSNVVTGNKLSKARRFSSLLMATWLSSLFLLGLIFTILWLTHRNVLGAILSDWSSYFIAGFFSLVTFAIGTYKSLSRSWMTTSFIVSIEEKLQYFVNL